MATRKLPRYRQDFFINSKHLGSTMRYGKQVHEELHTPASDAFFCPVCAVVWAVCPVTDTMTNEVSDFMPWRVPCAQHDKRWNAIPGSLFKVWDKEFNDGFPDALVQYEFNQAMKLYKEEDNE